MEQQFTKEQERYMTDKIFKYLDELYAEVISTINQTEAKANADFAAAGITFTAHSPANATFLKAVVHDRLFAELHAGDLALAQKILTMNAKQAGVSVHVDVDEE
ncbi:nitroreductase [Enterobacteriaceae bacterium RIT691]|nr:nitroreductase [Enterobacteriaceae bacterium RIT691]